jgi:DNA-binding SARP family transcriptional activator
MDYRILGPSEVCVDGQLVGLGGEKSRALLAILLLHRNEVVLADCLIDDLWGESPPPTALGTLRAYVSRVRKSLNGNGGSASGEPDPAPGPRDGVLLTRGRGYLLRVAPGELDLDRFRDLAERGHAALAAGRVEEAAGALREALGLWRGPPLADLAYEPFAQAAIAELEEFRLAAIEDRVEADLALGRSRELVGELRDLVARHPLRERLRGQLMLAFYRSARQAEALESYQAFRRRLAEELGLEPGPAVQQLERAILAHDRALGGSEAVTAYGGHEPRVETAIAGWWRRRRLVVALAGSVVAVMVAAAAILPMRGPRRQRAVIAGNSVGAITLQGDRAGAAVPLGTSPSALAAGGGALWVAKYSAGTVSRIDPAAHAVVQTIQVGRRHRGSPLVPGLCG